MPVRKSQIRKFLWLFKKLQTRKFLQNAAKLCLKAVIKVVFLKDFCYVLLIRALYAITKTEKTFLFVNLRKFKFANGIGPQIANPLSANVVVGPQIYNKLLKSANLRICDLLNLRGASKIKSKKVNKKRTVRVRRIIIFLNISRHPLLIWLHCCFHQYKTLKAVATAKAAIVLLTPARNLNKVFWGFLVVFPLFNHFLGYVEIYQRVIWPKKIGFETFERL